MKCSICKEEIKPLLNDKGEVVWDKGNNPAPFPHENGERCCDECNISAVLGARLGQYYKED